MSPQPGNHRLKGNAGRSGNSFPTRTAADIARIHRAYVDNELPLKEIHRRFRMTDHELNVMRDRHGWKSRGKNSKPTLQTQRKKPPKVRTEAQVRAARNAEFSARDAALYGRHLEDVQYLRWCGYIIDRHHLHGDEVRVGNKVITFAALREKAAMWRRLKVAA